MKTLLKLSGLILLVFALNTVNAEVIVPSVIVTDEATMDCTNGCLVKTTRWNGELIPVIDLPVVEIISKSTDTKLVSGYFDNGVLVFKADLPMVEINANRTNTNKIQATLQNGEVIGLVELPMIEINSDFPLNNLKPASLSDGTYIPVVNLPVINIIDDFKSSPVVKVNYIDQASVFALNSQENNAGFNFTALLKSSKSFDPMNVYNAEWFYVNLQKCGINLDGKEVCEVISQTRINTNALVNFSIKRIIYDNYVLILH